MDYGAAYPVDPRVLEAMIPYFRRIYGNPSSFHSQGFDAIRAMDRARKKVADLVGAESREIIFTSGATESNNLGIRGAALKNRKKGNKVVVSAIEHISVMNIVKDLSRQGFEYQICPVCNEGVIDLIELERMVDDDTVLVSVMAANGEIGTIQPIDKIAEITHNHDALFHTDATAAAGKIHLDMKGVDVDLMTLSSNDLYGPKGMGALYIKKEITVKPIIIGGGQEFGVRSGSENIPGMVGMGTAAEIASKEMGGESKRLRNLRDGLIDEILETIPESYLNGHPNKRLPNNANLRFSYIEGEALVLSLDDLGIQVSTGSACAAKTLEPSHCLTALGLKHEEAHGSLVFTLGKGNNDEHVDYVVKVMPGVVARLRALSPLTPEELK